MSAQVVDFDFLPSSFRLVIRVKSYLQQYVITNKSLTRSIDTERISELGSPERAGSTER